MKHSDYQQSLITTNKLSGKVDKTNVFAYIDAVITLKAHSWCMDVKSERRKMTRLTIHLIKELKNIYDEKG